MIMILEVDGQHHHEGSQTVRDYLRDRVLLREGIPTARFTAQECLNQTADVITEFLKLL
jgi:very-short-patch-repair endonuclease